MNHYIFATRQVAHLAEVPEDCRELVDTVLPYLVRVMRGGSGSYPPYDWGKPGSLERHLRHSEKHAERAVMSNGFVPRDHADDEPERAHQIVRLMMVFALELVESVSGHERPTDPAPSMAESDGWE